MEEKLSQKSPRHLRTWSLESPQCVAQQHARPSTQGNIIFCEARGEGATDTMEFIAAFILFLSSSLNLASASLECNDIDRLNEDKEDGEMTFHLHEDRDSCKCNPSDVKLADYPQWRAEKGYWIGECTLFDGNGESYTAAAWPYRYSGSRSFITGNIAGNAYRQRNVFLYAPESDSDQKCADNPEVVGEGKCGENGNSLVFFADQAVTSCSCSDDKAGDISGPFPSQFGTLHTTTELIGQDNALLYQVFHPPHMNPIQSQLTTLTKGPESDEFNYRTRTAQGFNFATGLPAYLSFYRERKVSKEHFYEELNRTIAEFNILDSDLCYLDGGVGRQPVDGYNAGYEQCVKHLQSTFLM